MSTRPISLHYQNRLQTSAILAGVSLFLTCALISCQGDRQEFFYASLVDAEKDGAIDRHWLPDFLPKSSREIHVAGDLSPSRTWCAFEFVPSDSQPLRNNLKKISVLMPEVRRVPSPRKLWWPTVLEGDLDLGKTQQAGFDLYATEVPATQVTNEILLFAIDWVGGRAFVFTTGLDGLSK